MKEELIKQIYGGELTAEATKLLKYIYAGAQPIEDNDFALMFGRMNLAKFVEVKAKEDEIIAKQGKKLKEDVKSQEKTITNLMGKLAKKSEDAAELKKTIKEQQQQLGHENELRGEVGELLLKLNKKCDEIVEKNTAIDELKAERDKLSDKVEIYKMDNFDLQADIDRLRHQLEAIKNVIAL